MKTTTLLLAGLLAAKLGVMAQGVDALAPSSVTPKAYRPGGAAAPSSTTQPHSPRTADGDKPLIAGMTIKGIVVVKSQAEIKPGGSSQKGVMVQDIPFLSGTDFWRMLERHLGKPLTENAIRAIQDGIILYCREHGKLLVDVILTEQNIENGVLQLWWLEGKVDKIAVRNEGTHWFRNRLIMGQMRLRSGDSVDSQKLTEDLNWINNNPFRQVDVAFKQGGKTEATPAGKIGLTDVELTVEDRFPVRPYIGYENSGTRFTGVDRFLAGLNWGNAFGLDHQFNYQYATDANFDLVKAHSASYLIPLPWRHTLLLYGSYVDGKADFSSIGDPTTAEGTSWQASIRYGLRLPSVNQLRHEVSAGFDFKRGDNSLFFGGIPSPTGAETDVAQFSVSYSGLLPDKCGRTSFGVEMYFSPGDLSVHNDDESYDELRKGTESTYFYARLNAERVTRLPYDFIWSVKAWAQVASERLLPSEQLALGGWNTIRGYDERVVLGDHGWIISNELRTPPWNIGNILEREGGQDTLQFLAFFDYGAVRIQDQVPDDGEDPEKSLYSVGGGLRYSVSRNFSFRLDYGWALAERDLNERNGRVHAAALLSF